MHRFVLNILRHTDDQIRIMYSYGTGIESLEMSWCAFVDV